MNSKSFNEGGKNSMYGKAKRFIASFLAIVMAVCMLPAEMLGAVGVVHAADGVSVSITGAENLDNGDTVKLHPSSGEDIDITSASTVDLDNGTTYTVVCSNGNVNVSTKVTDDGNETDVGEAGFTPTDNTTAIAVTITTKTPYPITQSVAVTVTGADKLADEKTVKLQPVSGDAVDITERSGDSVDLTVGSTYTVVCDDDNVDVAATVTENEISTEVTDAGFEVTANTTAIEVIITEKTQQLQVGAISATNSEGTAVTTGDTVAPGTVIKLANSTEGASIYYTTNGDTPDDTKQLYTDAGITLDTEGSVTIKAIAVKDNMTDSAILELTLTVQDDSGEVKLQNLVLNMSDMTAAEFSSNYQSRGFTILATSTNKVSIDANSKTVDGTKYTQRLKFGGTTVVEEDEDGNGTVAKSVMFETKAAATVSIIAMCSSSSSSTEVSVDTYNSETKELQVVQKFNGGNAIGGATSDCKVYEVSLSEAGTYYIAARTNAVNIYYISVTYEGITDVYNPQTVIVTFDTNGGLEVASQTVEEGGLCTAPATVKDGYRFAGWYTSADLTGDAYDFATPVNGTMTLYAKWEEETVQNHVLNMESISVGTYTKQFVKNGFTVIADASNTVSVETVSYTDADSETTYTQILKLNGSGDTSKRAIKFTITEESELTIIAAAGGTSKRTLSLESDEVTALKTTEDTSVFKITETLTPEETGTDYYVYGDNGYNIYYISVLPKTVKPEPPAPDAVADPVFTPALTDGKHTFETKTGTVHITSETEGAEISYVINKGENALSDEAFEAVTTADDILDNEKVQEYSASINVEEDGTKIKAIAVYEKEDGTIITSNIVTAEYDITEDGLDELDEPTATPADGETIKVGDTITLQATDGAVIRYTTNGSEPSSEVGEVYSETNKPTAEEAGTLTVKAIAYTIAAGGVSRNTRDGDDVSGNNPGGDDVSGNNPGGDDVSGNNPGGDDVGGNDQTVTAISSVAVFTYTVEGPSSGSDVTELVSVSLKGSNGTRVGSELTAELTFDPAGIPDDKKTSTTYVWYRVSSDGAKTEITGASDSTYTITEDDIGSSIKVVVTFRNEKDDTSTATATSAVVKESKTGFYVELVGSGTYTYTGSAIVPNIEVYNNDEKLTEGVDYTVKCSNNVNATVKKAAKLTVTGKGRFSGSQTVEFNIAQKNLNDNDVKAGSIVIVKGSKATPVLVYNGVKLAAKDIVVPTDKYTEVTTDASVTVKAKEGGNYTGERTIPVKVVESKNDLKKFTVALTKGVTYLYDGTEKTPSLDIKDASTKSEIVIEDGNTADNYYLVSYNTTDRVNAGVVKFTVIGMGEYTGSVSKSFTIKPADKNATTVTITGGPWGSDFTVPYTSAGVTFDSLFDAENGITVKDTTNELTLKRNRDYKVTYSANKKAGTGKVTVSYIGNYKGLKKVTQTFTIDKTVVDNSKLEELNMQVKFGATKPFTKEGIYKAPVILSMDGVTVKNSEFDIKYYTAPLNESGEPDANAEMKGSNKLQLADKVTAEGAEAEKEDYGIVYVVITGKAKGNFAGSVITGSYKVYKVPENGYDLSKAKVTFYDASTGKKTTKMPYTGNGIVFTPKDANTNVPDGANYLEVSIGKDIVPTSAYKVEYVNNVEKGKATVIIVPNEGDETNARTAAGSKTATFTIAAMSLKTLTDLLKDLFPSLSA